jgi:hypothetical protein
VSGRRHDERETRMVAAAPVERVVCWVNRWGDFSKHHGEGKSDEWLSGYDRAMKETYDRLCVVAPDWMETWRDEEWGHHKERQHV